MAAQPDSLLLEGLAKGDEAAFEALFLRYYSRVFAVAFRFLGDRDEADDVAQEVFLKLHGQRFGPGEQQLGGWLYRVATNLCLNRTRGTGRRERHEASAAGEASLTGQGGAPDPAAMALRGEERALVRRALAALPAPARAILLLRQTGLSYAEIGEAVGVAAGSVGTLLARAEEKFREQYLTLTGEEG
ncbi:MAG: sigma-70 family RNA polymerase sigma factor [Chloroflexota bacterium]